MEIVIDPAPAEVPALTAAFAVKFAIALEHAMAMRSDNGADLFRSHGRCGRLRKTMRRLAAVTGVADV